MYKGKFTNTTIKSSFWRSVTRPNYLMRLDCTPKMADFFGRVRNANWSSPAANLRYMFVCWYCAATALYCILWIPTMSHVTSTYLLLKVALFVLLYFFYSDIVRQNFASPHSFLTTILCDIQDFIQMTVELNTSSVCSYQSCCLNLCLSGW